jgi:hypothetical protein
MPQESYYIAPNFFVVTLDHNKIRGLNLIHDVGLMAVSSTTRMIAETNFYRNVFRFVKRVNSVRNSLRPYHRSEQRQK